MIFVSHDRMFLRGFGSRVLELGGESGTDRHPTVYPASYVEYCKSLDTRLPESIRRPCRGFCATTRRTSIDSVTVSSNEAQHILILKSLTQPVLSLISLAG